MDKQEIIAVAVLVALSAATGAFYALTGTSLFVIPALATLLYLGITVVSYAFKSRLSQHWYAFAGSKLLVNFFMAALFAVFVANYYLAFNILNAVIPMIAVLLYAFSFVFTRNIHGMRLGEKAQTGVEGYDSWRKVNNTNNYVLFAITLSLLIAIFKTAYFGRVYIISLVSVLAFLLGYVFYLTTLQQ